MVSQWQHLFFMSQYSMTLEKQWIKQLQARWPNEDFGHDTFFDAATQQILTTDMMVEGVHFSWEYCSPQDVGWKSIAVNLSDIAATGGLPQWVLVSIGVPESIGLECLNGIYEGIDAICREAHCVVVGGDTVRAEKTTISVTAIGKLPQNHQPGRRNTAEAGDIIVTSGSHGLSAAGLEALQRGLPGFDRLKQAHLRPKPKLALGQRMARVLPRYAMMDSSDGLADAALRLAEESGVDIYLDTRRIVLDPDLNEVAAKTHHDSLHWALYGGEDFQLVAALPKEAIGFFPEMQVVGVARPQIDEYRSGKGFLKQEDQLIPLDASATFQHFSSFETRIPEGEDG